MPDYSPYASISNDDKFLTLDIATQKRMKMSSQNLLSALEREHPERFRGPPKAKREAAHIEYDSNPVSRAVERHSLHPALSRDPCHRCGISGAKGCEHQLPFQSTVTPSVKWIPNKYER